MTLPTIHPLLLGLLNGAGAEDLASPPPDDPQWQAIIREADRHGLAPILYRWLNDSGRAAQLPPSALDVLKTQVFKLAARNLVLAQEAASILPAFESRQLVCAPVRGLALAELLYGDITARPMGDLDLLVRKDDLPAVAAALTELGFREVDRRPGFARTYSNTLEFVKDRHGWIIVEPHWTIAYPPFADRIDMDAVWKRCVRGRALGMETWLLSREDLVLHLCCHLVHKKDDAPLLWFYELDRLIRQAGAALDWSQVVQIARETGQSLLIAEALRSTRRLFATPVPESVALQLKAASARTTPSVGGFADHRVAHLLAGDSCADGRESLTLFFAIKGLRAKIRYLSALLFPSSEFMRLNYGLSSSSHLGFCYLGRMAYLIREGLKGTLGLLALRRSRSSTAN
ncbi:MAG: hypothetical protein EPO02_03045 [Nitrospirae bacterium]|nr:MAG: hypothetical protein EPO02_03045 [Nitrospirota bacterium]